MVPACVASAAVKEKMLVCHLILRAELTCCVLPLSTARFVFVSSRLYSRCVPAPCHFVFVSVGDEWVSLCSNCDSKRFLESRLYSLSSSLLCFHLSSSVSSKLKTVAINNLAHSSCRLHRWGIVDVVCYFNVHLDVKPRQKQRKKQSESLPFIHLSAGQGFRS